MKQNALKIPCHDPITGWDCPNRCGGCQTSCAEWQAYDQEKRKAYDERMAANVSRYARRDSFARAWARKFRYRKR